jgi:uncharacterized protein (TIGR03435 family)
MTHCNAWNPRARLCWKAAGVIFLSAALSIYAQPRATAATALEFDVASVKPSDPGTAGGSIRPGGATFAASSMPVIGLVAFAYDDIRPDRIDGAPGWMLSEPYDIVAKSRRETGDARADLGRQRQMLQTLLADRFQLKIHHESRERPIYALVVDKSGPRMKENNDLKSAPGPDDQIHRKGQGYGADRAHVLHGPVPHESGGQARRRSDRAEKQL